MRFVAFILVALFAAGCAHRQQPGSPLVTPVDVFLYAQLAQNAYLKSTNTFELDPDVTEAWRYPDESPNVAHITGDKANDIFGLAFQVYKHRRQDRAVDTIFAFRGTEGGFDLASCDFRFGNLRAIQQRLATELVGRHLAKNPIEPDRVVFVGHSLGGGIARHVSMRFQGGRVYAFNTSPVFEAPDHYRPREDPTLRYSVNTAGEILKITRVFGPEPTQIYWKVPCYVPGGLISNHSMRALATCLTVQAAAQVQAPTTAFPGAQEMARSSIRANEWAFSSHPVPDQETVEYRCPR